MPRVKGKTSADHLRERVEKSRREVERIRERRILLAETDWMLNQKQKAVAELRALGWKTNREAKQYLEMRASRFYPQQTGRAEVQDLLDACEEVRKAIPRGMQPALEDVAHGVEAVFRSNPEAARLMLRVLQKRLGGSEAGSPGAGAAKPRTPPQ